MDEALRDDSHIGSGTVVTDDIRVVLTEARIEFVLSKVSHQLNPSAVHHIFTEMDHTVEVVVMSRFGVFGAISVHCN